MQADRDCVLVVEDDEMLLELFEELLGRQYAVRIARGVDEAMRELDEHEIAAVVTDLHIGMENGLVLIERVRRCYPHLSSRLLLLTGVSASEVRKFGVPVLTKPVDGGTLLDAVNGVITRGTDAVS